VPVQPTIPVGLTVQFTATGNYQDGSHHDITSQVTWSSSTSTVATVENGTTGGLATAKAVGSTTIRVDLGAISANATLTVTSATLISIAVTPASPSVVAGKSVPLSATGTFHWRHNAGPDDEGRLDF
jgi:uncharacterized protein YjdB